jgi:hypothetical protein
MCISSDVILKVSEHVYRVIHRYIKEDVQRDGIGDELIVKFSNVVKDSPDIIDDQVNEIDVSRVRWKMNMKKKEKWEINVARNTTTPTLLYKHIISSH